ncbi:MAG: LLM class flavin-dependent oxidoreductase, partial [Haloechinothrix sp.]
MNATRFGLTYGVSSREPLTRAGELARHAEELGFARMWFVDVQLSMKDAYIAMALAAQATSAIHLGPGVSNPVTRHVSVTANGLSAVHELSHGRAMAGYGLGHTAVYPVGLKPAKLAPFEQDLQALRSLLAGNIVSTGNVSYELLTVDK